MKYWERKKGSKSVAVDQNAGATRGRGGATLKPLDAEEKRPGPYEVPITSEGLFRGFCKAGNIDRPELGIPLQRLDDIVKLRKYVEEQRAKKANGAMATSFYHVLRANEDLLKGDIQFQRKLLQ